MDRHQTILAELGPSDLKNTSVKIDLVAIQAKRFAGPQTRARQQSDHGRQDRSPMWISRRDATA